MHASSCPGSYSSKGSDFTNEERGAIKRERAIAYSLSRQKSRSCASPYCRRTSKSALSLKNQSQNNSSPGWSGLDHWMTTKPWEKRLVEEFHTNSSEIQLSRKSEDNIASFYFSKHDSVKLRKNIVASKILAKSPAVNHVTCSSSAPSSECQYNESSVSTSSTSPSPIPFSMDMLVADRVQGRYSQKTAYMNLTKSNKLQAKKQQVFFSKYSQADNRG
ncbi:hypothetical protein POPTR_001G197101v4 [Populus trichocarpa]|uniref:Uncharacterized protein n=1 Tax=Populus trichocarpa TaxID=3694 RepID=A0ACC0TKR0_POPTR|nr:hypothetical protein POPTR_001G197101v4 [Populus trichocarpa]